MKSYMKLALLALCLACNNIGSFAHAQDAGAAEEKKKRTLEEAQQAAMEIETERLAAAEAEAEAKAEKEAGETGVADVRMIEDPAELEKAIAENKGRLMVFQGCTVAMQPLALKEAEALKTKKIAVIWTPFDESKKRGIMAYKDATLVKTFESLVDTGVRGYLDVVAKKMAAGDKNIAQNATNVVRMWALKTFNMLTHPKKRRS